MPLPCEGEKRSKCAQQPYISKGGDLGVELVKPPVVLHFPLEPLRIHGSVVGTFRVTGISCSHVSHSR